MRGFHSLSLAISAITLLSGCGGEESTSDNIAVEVPFSLSSIPMPNDGYGYDADGTISLPGEPSSPNAYSTNAEYDAYYQNFETSFAAVDGWGLCVEPIEIPLSSVGSEQVIALEPTSLQGNVLLIDGTTRQEVPNTKLSSDGRKLIIECGAALQPGTEYFIAVSNGVMTVEGIPLQSSPAFAQLLSADPNELDEQQRNLQQKTKNAVSAYSDLGKPNEVVYASTFTTQNSYSIIDNIVQQTIADPTSPPTLDLTNIQITEVNSARPSKAHVIVSGATLETNNYLPFTQNIADKEKCLLDSYDPTTNCPSMYNWTKGENGEHLTHSFFGNQGKVAKYNDSTTTIPVDFYLPYIVGTTDSKAGARQFIKDTTNPSVIFIHGVTGDKESASLVAKEYVTDGKEYIFAAIDMPYHGARIVCDSSNYSNETTLKYCDSGKPISARADKSYFINITSPLTLRSNLHQSVSDFIGLRWALNFGNDRADREVHLIGVSLGGIMSVMTTEATYKPESPIAQPIEGLALATSNYVVPGQGLVNLTLSSLTLGSEMETSVKKSADVQRAIAETLLPSICYEGVSNETCITSLQTHSAELEDSIEMLENEIYSALIPILKQGVQQTIDGSDPAGKVSRQVQAQQPTLLIEAVGDCGETCEIGEYMPDTVVPNNAENNVMTGTDPLIHALELNDITSSTTDSPIRGVIRATVGGHGTFLFPYEGPMDETGLPSQDPKHMEAGNNSRITQQEAVRNMVATNARAIYLDSDDLINIEDETDEAQ